MATRLTPRVPCACGCGEPADARSRYRGDHHAILVAARRRLREARRLASRRGHPFALGLEDVHPLVREAWPADEGLALRRIDPADGWVPSNIILSSTRGGRPRTSTQAKLRRRFERLVQRMDLQDLDARDLAHLFVQQDARCAVSGRLLRTNTGRGDPDSLSVALIDPGQPPTRHNIMLVTAWVAAAARGWGSDRVVEVAQDIARHQRALRDGAKPRKGAGTRGT